MCIRDRFFGVMGVAPQPRYGTISTIQPREHGGNLDNKELTAGSILFLPVWAPGANFSAGDGHGVQGLSLIHIWRLVRGKNLAADKKG